MLSGKYRSRLRRLGAAVVQQTELLSGKFVVTADFSGISCLKILAQGPNTYVALPPDAEAVRGGRYVFYEEGLLGQLFPDKHVYPIDEDLLVFTSEPMDETTVFTVSEEQKRKYYLYLALYSAMTQETDKGYAKKQEALLAEENFQKIEEELLNKTNAEKREVIRKIAKFPPLFGLPDETVRKLLTGVEEKICFPGGGVWSGLVPLLAECGVKKIYLPADGAPDSFVWRTGDSRVTAICGAVLNAEQEILWDILAGYRGYPVLTDMNAVGTEERTGEIFPLPQAVVFAEKPGEIPAEGVCIAEIGKRSLTNGKVVLTEKRGKIVVDGRFEIGLVVRRPGVKRPGKIAERRFSDGKFAVWEGHYYYRKSTARLRVLLDDGKSVYVETMGSGDFALTLKMEGVKSIVCALPFKNASFEARDGLYRARERMVFAGDNGYFTVKSHVLSCEKKGDEYLLFCGKQKSLFIID